MDTKLNTHIPVAPSHTHTHTHRHTHSHMHIQSSKQLIGNLSPVRNWQRSAVQMFKVLLGYSKSLTIITQV